MYTKYMMHIRDISLIRQASEYVCVLKAVFSYVSEQAILEFNLTDVKSQPSYHKDINYMSITCLFT